MPDKIIFYRFQNIAAMGFLQIRTFNTCDRIMEIWLSETQSKDNLSLAICHLSGLLRILSEQLHDLVF